MKRSRPSIAREVFATSLIWLFLGCVFGVIEGVAHGEGAVRILAMMIGGVTVLPIMGVLLGIIGGDAIGSGTGAAGGLLGCLGAGLGLEAPIQGHVMSVIVIFSALVGATAFLFVRFMIWKYTMIFRTICWAIGVTPAQVSAWAIDSRFLEQIGHGTISVHGTTRPKVDAP